MTGARIKSGLVDANGARLHHEIRGDGPLVLFVAGGGGDGGMFEKAADLLADAYTVLTYDRRANSRSPRPNGWTSTTIAEQADDCVALIGSIGLDPPIVLGHSLGGTILVDVLERHPRVLRGAIVFEPNLPSVAPSFAEFAEQAAMILAEQDGLVDARAAMDRFVRWAFGAEVWGMFPSELRSRIIGNGEVPAGIEFPAVAAFAPDAAALAAVEAPIHTVHGEETEAHLRWVVESAQWVSRASGGPLSALPGGHVSFMDRPIEFVGALRPILASMTSDRP